jgi:opacity protein-like surface antigen
MGSAALILTTVGAGAAQTIQDRIDALEGKVAEQGKKIEETLGIDIHALVSTAYTYSFNNPDTNFIFPRNETNKHNSIDLYQGTLFFSRMREEEDFGFAINLDFGSTAETTQSDWDGDGTLTSDSEETNSFELREAYLKYKTPFELPGGRISLKGGKFVTLLGYEVIMNWDNFNYNVSKAFLFGYAIAFTHVGLLANFPIHDMVSFDLGVVNGWDNVQDSNDGKSLLTGLGITPSDIFSMYFAATYGAEQPDNGKSKRGTVTANFSLQATEQLKFVLDGVYAKESDLVPDGTGDLDSADWYGGAFYIIFNPIERLTLAMRTEVFDDADGVRLAPATLSPTDPPRQGRGSTIWEISPAIAYALTDHITARIEYRHDRSSAPIFDKDDHASNVSNTLSTQLIFAF